MKTATTDAEATASRIVRRFQDRAKAAQAAFDKDPEGLANLDPDGNGVACEELLESDSQVRTSKQALSPRETPSATAATRTKSRRRRRS